MFGFLKQHVTKIYEQFTAKARSIFGRATIDPEFFEAMRTLLLGTDLGTKLTNQVIQKLQSAVKAQGIADPAAVENLLQEDLLDLISGVAPANVAPQVIILVGINGSGKTTSAGKLCKLLAAQGKKVLLVAGDTFRAAATEQLQEWGQKSGIRVFCGEQYKDPSSLVFDACKEFLAQNYDHMIIDTAGRLQTKVNLMHELSKINRTVTKQMPAATMGTWLTIDAMLGQNSLDQARTFHEATKLDGLVLTKMDGSAKGGTVIAIVHELKVPVVYYSFGEGVDQIAPFDAARYVAGFFEEA